MKFSYGDLVQVKCTKELVIVLEANYKRHTYTVQYDNYGKHIEEINADEVE